MTTLPTAIPTPRQLEFQSWEWGIFLHFGIRTFYEGHLDWDGKTMDATGFAPSALDCDQWARTAKEAGARYMVLTAKHHDGFAIWPSAYTDYSVASSPWKGGKGDVIREYVNACRRHDLKVGLYYSPMDAAGKKYDNPTQYDDYFIAQASEILAGYGAIDILWFDGCGSEGHVYDWPRIMAEVRRLQPNILIFNMGDPDFRWVGNESGIAPVPIYNTVDSVAFSVQTDEQETVGRPMWLPAECDCRMRDRNWFYSDADADTVKSVEELMGLYYLSVGRGCNFLLNIGPDRRGLLPDPDTARLEEFGVELRRRLGRAPVATLDDASRTGDIWKTTFDAPTWADHLIVGEDLTAGETVRRFRIQVALFPHAGQPITVYEGHNIGHKAICRFPLVRASGLILEILESDGPPVLSRLDYLNTSAE